MIGLPTLQALDRAAACRIWLAAEPADMRCGFDRLAELAGVVTEQNPLDGHLFLFRGRRGDRLKILYFDRDGWALCERYVNRTHDAGASLGGISQFPLIRQPGVELAERGGGGDSPGAASGRVAG